MKKIIINEKQEKFLINEAMKQGFSIDTLYSLPSFNTKIKYCKEMLGNPIGKGSSRMVFQIDDETVLKLAINAKGIAQNEQEGQKDWYLENLGITPKVYHNYNKEDDYTFIVSEYVLPAKKRDFKECLGIDFGTFVSFLVTSHNNHCSRNQHLSMPTLSNETYVDLLENNEDLNAFDEYIGNYNPMIGDFLRISNLGMVYRNGKPQIVILDNGINKEIYDKFYRHR